MPNWPIFSEGGRYAGIGTAATSSGAGVTVLPTPGAVNTKVAYTQLVASTPFAIGGFILVMYVDVSPVNQRHLLDIAVGAAGAEQDIVQNLYFNELGLRERYVFIPIGIDAGQRVSARHQSGNALGNFFVGMYGVALGYQLSRPFSRMTSYGVNLASTLGTQLDPGAVAGTKGAYSQLAAATSVAHKACLMVVGRGDDFASGDILWAIDWSLGAAASEQVIVPDLTVGKLGSGVTARALGPSAYVGPIPLSIASGTRVAARALSTTNDEAQRQIDVAFYGFS